MKKLLTVLLIALLVVTMAVVASADLYSPEYYGVLKVDAGAITVDGAVDEAYGEPIFYYEAFGPDATEEQIGDITSSANWFFTKDTSENLDDVLSLVYLEENYARGYAVWTDTSLYVCVDTNITGWNYPEGLTPFRMWQAYCLQLGIFDFESGDNNDVGLAIDMAGNTVQRNFGQNKNTSAPSKDFPIVNTKKVEDPVAAHNPSWLDQTELNAKVTRDGSNVIYEIEIPFATSLSFIPAEGDYIGLDICVNFGDCPAVNAEGAGDGAIQKCLTFVNKGSAGGFHSRDINFARPLYFVTAKADADAAYAAKAAEAAEKLNKEELAADEDGYSIGLFGANAVPANTKFTLDKDSKTGGSGSLLLIVKNGEQNVNRWAIDPVDGTGYDSLEFDMLVSDISIFDATLGSNQLEITSGGQEDAEEQNWSMAAIKEQNQGDAIVEGEWFHVILPIPADSKLNLANVNFMGFYMVAPELEKDVAIQLDNFRLSKAQAAIEEEAKEDAAKVEEDIMEMDEITADNYEKMVVKVNARRASYNKLSDLAKTFITADALAKLEAAEKAIADFKANPPEEDTTDDDTTGDETTGDDTTGGDTTDDETTGGDTTTDDNKKNDDDGNGWLIWVIIGGVVVVAVVVVVIIVSKKKK